jgi:hypothetical protein
MDSVLLCNQAGSTGLKLVGFYARHVKLLLEAWQCTTVPGREKGELIPFLQTHRSIFRELFAVLLFLNRMSGYGTNLLFWG